VKITAIRCGIPDCDWGEVLDDPAPLSPDTMSIGYELWRNHSAEFHSDGSGDPGEIVLRTGEAEWFVDTDTGGTLTVKMTPTASS